MTLYLFQSNYSEGHDESSCIIWPKRVRKIKGCSIINQSSTTANSVQYQELQYPHRTPTTYQLSSLPDSAVPQVRRQAIQPAVEAPQDLPEPEVPTPQGNINGECILYILLYY